MDIVREGCRRAGQDRYRRVKTAVGVAALALGTVAAIAVGVSWYRFLGITETTRTVLENGSRATFAIRSALFSRGAFLFVAEEDYLRIDPAWRLSGTRRRLGFAWGALQAADGVVPPPWERKATESWEAAGFFCVAAYDAGSPSGSPAARRRGHLCHVGVQVPAYSVVLATGIVIAASLWQLRHLRSPRTDGRRCECCGYDMRATPDRCPECGHEAGPPRVTDGTRKSEEIRDGNQGQATIRKSGEIRDREIRDRHECHPVSW